MSNYDYLFKCIMIGDMAVGKSCIMLRFTQQKFMTQHNPTLGVQYATKIINVNGLDIKVQIWDTVIYIQKSGQQSFRGLTRSYYKGAIIAMLVYDVTRRDSFDNILKWLNEVNNYSNDKVEILLIGNKIDLSNRQFIMSRRQVKMEDGSKLAKNCKFQFFQTSAKQGYNIGSCFKKAVSNVLAKINSKVIDINSEAFTNYGIKKGKRKQNNQIFLNNSEKSFEIKVNQQKIGSKWWCNC